MDALLSGERKLSEGVWSYEVARNIFGFINYCLIKNTLKG